MEVASGHLEYEQADADALSAVSTRPLTGLWHEAAHLPIEQIAKSEARNQLKTAKALSLTFPITLLGRADEVIE